jgi:hypothetical protein
MALTSARTLKTRQVAIDLECGDHIPFLDKGGNHLEPTTRQTFRLSLCCTFFGIVDFSLQWNVFRPFSSPPGQQSPAIFSFPSPPPGTKKKGGRRGSFGCGTKSLMEQCTAAFNRPRLWFVIAYPL